MGSQEPIKHISKIRRYIRQFFVCGFKGASAYIYTSEEDKSNEKMSKKSFDNLKSRVISFLGKSMEFKALRGKGKVFLSADSRTIKTNPFYDIFKTKSFTKNDIILRFLILDHLADGKEHSLNDIHEICNKDVIENIKYSGCTCENKLEELTEFGLITKKREKYRIVKHSEGELEDIKKLKNAIVFFSEADPLGVIGYFTTEMFDKYPDLFRFKQKYIFRAIDSEVLYQLVCAIESEIPIKIKVVREDYNEKKLITDVRTVFPYKNYISSQNGRQYLFYWKCDSETPPFVSKTPSFVRIDQIETVERLPKTKEVLYQLVCAIESEIPIKIKVVREDNNEKKPITDVLEVLPCEISISSQTEQQYLSYRECKSKTLSSVRIDQIETVERLPETKYINLDKHYDEIKDNFWGVSSKYSEKTEHIEFVVKIEEGEQYILDKLENEKRCGKVDKVENSENLWKFSVDVYDTLEIVVWIRTFIGRLVSISCENEQVLAHLKNDFDNLCKAYEEK